MAATAWAAAAAAATDKKEWLKIPRGCDYVFFV
jgi:hypothetical protein